MCLAVFPAVGNAVGQLKEMGVGMEAHSASIREDIFKLFQDWCSEDIFILKKSFATINKQKQTKQ